MRKIRDCMPRSKKSIPSDEKKVKNLVASGEVALDPYEFDYSVTL